MGLLDGKKIVVTGVLTDASLAFGVARLAREEGADIVLTGAGRALSLTQRTARKLGDDVEVFELDVTAPEHGVAVREALADRWGHVDGVVHSIGFAPEVCLGDDFLAAQWDDVAVALHISAYSLKALADAFLPLMGPGGAFVGFDFDNQQAWPAYNWMGVAKSALQSVSRYLAKEVGPRGHPLQPRRRRPRQDHGRQVDPRLRRVRGHLGRPRSARLGRHELRAGRPSRHRTAVGLVPRHHRRDHPRRRRLPRHGCVMRRRPTPSREQRHVLIGQ
jgi:meromycolic acid enoyl-[acyl-carrier-protein] reductase